MPLTLFKLLYFTRDCSGSFRIVKTSECKFTMAGFRKPIVNFATNSFARVTTNAKHEKVLKIDMKIL